MMLLALDPSSSCVGWAAGEVDRDQNGRPQLSVLEAGRLVGKRTTRYVDRCSLFALEVRRIAKRLVQDDESRFLIAVVEIPGGKVHAGRHEGGGSGLSIYGFACGAIWQALSISEPNGPFRAGILAEEWTGGHPKAKRALVAKRKWPAYDAKHDPGGDVADAIALAEWWTCFRATDALGATGT